MLSSLQLELKTESDVLLGLSPNTSISDTEVVSLLNQALDLFTRSVNIADLDAHAANMAASFDEALMKGSELTMLPNYSIDPTGEEHGNFLVIDLGGSTLRVAVISISPPLEGQTQEQRIHLVTSRKWQVENSNKVVNSNFFAWIGSNIKTTLESQDVILADSVINTGITWSFPLESTSCNSANILHMGKGYEIDKDIFGHDLKDVLESSVLEHQNIKINVESIINDSLAVYAAGCFIDSKTKLAMVLGTGLNFCCLLATLGRIHDLKHLASENHCLFNTETSLFGQELVEPFATKYDTMIDSRFDSVPPFSPHMSLDPQTNVIFQPSELLASGRYLPELVRLVLVEMVHKGDIFCNQKNFSRLYTQYEIVNGEFLCFVHECDDNLKVSAMIECAFGWLEGLVLMNDVVSLRLLVDAVIRRAAFIVAIAIVAFIKLLASHNGGVDNKVITIGYVGSVMTYFKRMRNMIGNYVNQCTYSQRLGVKIELQEVHESSLVGSAIGAACHAK